jgi:hypothetical protein
MDDIKALTVVMFPLQEDFNFSRKKNIFAEAGPGL